jgi:hypothetical protein
LDLVVAFLLVVVDFFAAPPDDFEAVLVPPVAFFAMALVPPFYGDKFTDLEKLRQCFFSVVNTFLTTDGEFTTEARRTRRGRRPKGQVPMANEAPMTKPE